MPEFTIIRHLDAPIDKVWEVLDNFGDIASWSPGVKRSALTSQGPVSEGTTRHCDFTPLGAVEERIEAYIPNERMTVKLYETSKLPISSAVADFSLEPHGDGTQLTLNYNYTLNRLGRIAKGQTDKQMRKGMNGLVGDLDKESQRIATN